MNCTAKRPNKTMETHGPLVSDIAVGFTMLSPLICLIAAYLWAWVVGRRSFARRYALSDGQLTTVCHDRARFHDTGEPIDEVVAQCEPSGAVYSGHFFALVHFGNCRR